jgi:alpha-amylase/alpha-mannosidase (GH57 family)
MDCKQTAQVVLCWHMHQPSYKDASSGEFLFPWVYLHAAKDYADMAAHLEAHPKAQAVVNFAPVLLEQIEDYLAQIARWEAGGDAIRDPLLRALVASELPEAGSTAFMALIEKCLRAHPERIINRFPPFAKIAGLARYSREHPELQQYLSRQFLVDLLVWYHIGWMGEIFRRGDKQIVRLQDKGRDYSDDDRHAVLKMIADALAGIAPRYRRLAEKGQIELSVTPYTHPMLPLLLDIKSARESVPDSPLPNSQHYPGGEERCRWQLKEARAVFRRFFNLEPAGCWASEGGLSEATVHLLEEEGFRWTATGDSVLHKSVHKAREQGIAEDDLSGRIHTVYKLGNGDIGLFFRDDGLSDRIGFNYSDWHAEDAVGDLIHLMENIRKLSPQSEPCIIPIIMDGENAWEFFPENGYYFMDELYRRLSDHPNLHLTTFSDLMDQKGSEATRLPGLVAGSWIDGTFTTWMGHPDKNRGWDWLCEAKQHYDEVMASGRLSAEEARKASYQLALCEGSDWFWWFGDDNPAAVVSDFEHLFRRHLVNLYSLIGHPVPDHIFERLSLGRADATPAMGGSMRPGHAMETS